jgi:hypothetical protein
VLYGSYTRSSKIFDMIETKQDKLRKEIFVAHPTNQKFRTEFLKFENQTTKPSNNIKSLRNARSETEARCSIHEATN